MSQADRREPRAPVKMSAEIESQRTGTFTAVTRDISVGGAALECERALTEGEQIRLALFLVYEGIEDERTPPLMVGARVQWAADGDDGSHTAGIKFEAISEAQKEWLARVLKVTRSR